MKNGVNQVIHFVLTVFVVTIFVLICMYHSSCHVTPEGITLVSDGVKTVKIIDYAIDEGLIEVWFSDRVSVEKVFAVEAVEANSSIDNFLNCESKIGVEWNYAVREENGIRFNVKEKTIIGKRYELFACVKDKKGNTLSFTIPFYGENKNFPVIVISEVSDYFNKKDGVSEYIELYAVTSGNLFGLELESCSDGKCFELPCVEVRKGEYILVHLRNGMNSVNGKRDVLIDNDEPVLNSNAEIILLKNKVRSIVVDCVMYCKQDYGLQNDNWKNEKLVEAARICKDYGLWEGDCLPSDAVYSLKRKATSFVSRTNIARLNGSAGIKNSKDNWMCTAKSKTTPGRQNQW
ncbi:MAG: hypothetical protein IK002_00055 [Treponema sp.]|uniref:hypothetical protein n=1 Tax=Treponema sp. TaxID=166 RepID=UPI00298E6DB7|nr:hypothetical protein [Treponema sp.]MBR5932355.1 hypothetical protein [Treponema sp.]